MPVNTFTLSAELQCVVASVKTIPIFKKINDKYAEKYFSAVTKRVKCSKEDHDTQRKNNRTILIKVSIIIHHRSKQSGLRLSWIYGGLLLKL